MRNPPKSRKNPKSDQKESPVRRRLAAPNKSAGYRRKTNSSKNEVTLGDEAKSSENALFESSVKVITSKGFKVTKKAGTDPNLVISRCVEVPDSQYIVDIVPLRFHYGGGPVRYSNENGSLHEIIGETDGINELCDKLIEETQDITSILSEADNHSEGESNDNSNSLFVEGLEGYSVNILLRRINYFKLHGKSVRFWVNPVLIVSSRLEDQAGESTSWIPIKVEPSKCGVDIVNTANLPSYLDFREREVRNLGGQLLRSQEDLEIFPKALRLFRIMTVCAAMTLLAGFFILALGKSNDSLTPVFALGLATIIEALGGQRLFKGYRSIHENHTMIQAGSPTITPEQLAKSEEEFLPDERTFLYRKYHGLDLSKLRSETRRQRIGNLVGKSREILTQTGKLENDELFSEVALTCDRATSTALSAVLLSVGVETQGKDIEAWFPHLRRTLQNLKLEDIRYLRQLRDRVNKGYDASREEAQRAKQIALPLIGDTLQYLETHCSKIKKQSSTHNEDHPTETTGNPEPRILGEKPDSITRDPKRSLKPIDVSETALTTRATIATPAKFSDELDKITKSLNETWTDTEESKDKETDLLKWASDENSPIPQVMLFESLGDFRIVTTRRKSPIVASFLSDDEPSKEVKSAMDNLVTKYHKRAAFIYVTSKSKDIARECKIKSYPTVLVFHKGKIATELKSLGSEQLDDDLSKMLGATSPANDKEDREEKHVLLKNGDVDSTEPSRDDEVHKLEVTDTL